MHPGLTSRADTYGIPQHQAAEEAIFTLREQLDRENIRANRAETRAEQAESRADQVRDRLGSLEVELQEAKGAATAPRGNEAGVKELHYSTGFWGRLARFVLRRRAAGDPWENTLFLPPVILVIFAKLSERGEVPPWVLILAILLPPVVAGLWLGTILGGRGILRIGLRGAMAGLIGGGMYVPLTSETLDKQHQILLVFNSMFLSYFLFFSSGLLSAVVADGPTISESQWQASKPRRAAILKAVLLYPLKLRTPPNDESIAIVIVARLVQRIVIPIFVPMLIAGNSFQVTPAQFVLSLIAQFADVGK
jgi:hypothetical protein